MSLSPVEIAAAVYGTIAEFKDGAPSGPLYAALTSQGVSFDEYNRIILALIKANLITQRGNLLYPVAAAKPET
jgi:hypothetical protein